MEIKNMFANDIDRSINGVIKVAQDDEASLKQELSEYIITKELRKHFDVFFDNYSRSIDTPTNNIGVWISGFYGSGKSHFLKMLSYLLSNKVVDGKKTIDYFENKFEDHVIYANVKRCTDIPTETILFNIDIVGGAIKDKTAILKVFAKVFYNHLGYYGEDLKIVKLERYIAKQGKTEEFKKTFKEINGEEWEDSRDSFAFFEDDVVETLVKVLGMSESSASNWFNGEETAEISIESLVEDINEYINSKEKNFRLLFMVDEVGQYINSDVDMKINLQSIVEQLGSVCKGKAWVVVTSQEAIDSFTTHSNMDFSGIMGRFNTKLSLTSSSADEVIKKRILLKNENAKQLLDMTYDREHAVLKNLFTFSNDCVLDLKGFRNSPDYVETYPFIPYQFVIIQKVFDAIRNYGIASKHQSSGERSLLECYQIASQKVKNNDENTLVPFYYFYDTVSNALDTTIRRVIDRCQKASDMSDGIEPQDVNVLKLLYLLRYIDDISSNIDNISILMIDDIRVDKIKLREDIKESLGRLINSNYVARSGDKYNFLTDEEQDVARDISNTTVGSADIRKRIADTIFGEIYETLKYKNNKYNFEFEKYIDETIKGRIGGDVKLRIVTVTGDLYGSPDEKLIHTSHANNEAIVVLSDSTPYYTELEQSIKIRNYLNRKNNKELSPNVKDIVNKYRREADDLEKKAKEYIEKAITESKVFVNGEKFEMTSNNAKEKLDLVLNSLIDSVYSKLSMIDTFYESDADILKVLNEPMTDLTLTGVSLNNEEALLEISQWLEFKTASHVPVTMGDVQRFFQGAPFGWREHEIAGAVAKLIVQQKIEIRYGGAIVGTDDRRLVEYLRKKSEIDKASVIRHIPVDEELIRKTIKFYREYLGNLNMPEDEAGLIDHTIDTFERKKDHYNELLYKYHNKSYPQKELVISARDLMSSVLAQKNDNVALLKYIISRQDDLLDMQEDMENIETFFKSQVIVFDKARDEVDAVNKEKDYFFSDEEMQANISEIKIILSLPKPYNRIKELPDLIQKIENTYSILLESKKEEVRNIITQCMGDIHTLVDGDVKLKNELKSADLRFSAKRDEVSETTKITNLDAMITQLLNYKDTVCKRIEDLRQVTEAPTGNVTPVKQVKSTSIRRYDLCPAKRLQSNEDIDKYVEEMRKKLYQTLENNDVIQIN